MHWAFDVSPSDPYSFYTHPGPSNKALNHMPNAAAHTLGAAIGVGLIHMAHENATERRPSGMPFASAGLAACFGCLPDRLEPAVHPNHRQFFHSLAFGALVFYVGKKVYEWRPEDDFDKATRYVALVGIAAYCVHLAMDALTKKSLPLVGKL